jgi:hypothetical protein
MLVALLTMKSGGEGGIDGLMAAASVIVKYWKRR